MEFRAIDYLLLEQVLLQTVRSARTVQAYFLSDNLQPFPKRL
jgi:hypothetical protein